MQRRAHPPRAVLRSLLPCTLRTPWRVLLAAWLLAGAPAGADPPTGGVHGIDVSHYSGTVEWERVADAGYSFAYVKATEGVDGADPSFAAHWRRLPEVGLRRGAYHFYVTEDDPEAQARFFLDTVETGPGDLVPAVDVELIGHGTEPGLAGRLRTFLERVETELGVRPVVYTSPKFWDANLGEGFGAHPLWVAEYEVESPRVPAGWTRWHVWQWKDSHDVPGVEKDADVSRLHPEVDLEDLTIPATD